MVLAPAPTAFSDALPPLVGKLKEVASEGVRSEEGLSARVSSLGDALADVVEDLRPELLVGSDAASLYGSFCRLDRLVMAAKTLLAPRIAESGHWEAEGFRSPAALLAELEGGSTGAAKRTLATGTLLTQLPGTEEALRTGTLSGAKVAEIAGAAGGDPDAEGQLLAGAAESPLQVVKERCQRVRATSASRDPMAAWEKIHRERSFRSWTDADGAFCFTGRDTAERGARLLAALTPVANRLRDDRRAAARDAAPTGPKGAPGSTTSPRPETEEALRADAFFLLLTGRRSAPGDRRGTSGETGQTGHSEKAGLPGKAGSERAGRPGNRAHARRPGTGILPGFGRPSATAAHTATDTDPTSDDATNHDPTTLDLAGADDLIAAAPPATVMVRIDLEALRRGRAAPGECSEIDGSGPVPVPVVAGLMDDAFLALVFTEAGDIRAVSHQGRTINRHLRTALAFRDRCCVVPGCRVPYGLEIDHVVPMAHGGPTEIDNLALLCRHHHRIKTYEGWTLERTGPSDEDPRWTFTPLPPFGQEPGLGSQAPPEPVPRD